MADAYIVDAVRTAGGRRGGKLAGVHPVDLGAAVRAPADCRRTAPAAEGRPRRAETSRDADEGVRRAGGEARAEGLQTGRGHRAAGDGERRPADRTGDSRRPARIETRRRDDAPSG